MTIYNLISKHLRTLFLNYPTKVDDNWKQIKKNNKKRQRNTENTKTVI